MTEDLRVSVDCEPEPGLLRPAIEAALTGRPWPPGPEAQVAAHVAAAVRRSYAGGPQTPSAATTGDPQPAGIRAPATGAPGGEGR